MMPLHVVVWAKGLDAAARREFAARATQGSQSDQAELRRELQQAAREVAQEARAAAQEARDAAKSAAREGARTQATAQGADVQSFPQIPGMPVITKSANGRTMIVNPDGKATVIEPDGRVTTINEDGRITQSAHPMGPDTYGMDPGAALSLSALSAFVFFFLGRWWSARGYKKRAAQGGLPGEAGELGGRMERIEQAVEAVAIEVERISEGQRFTTKLLSEMRSPAPLAVGEPRR